ncbi:MAG: hypothetical protein V4436_02050 [Patescibacteria group bacterium]
MPNKGTVRLEAARKYIRKMWLELTDAELAVDLDMNIVSVRRLRYRMGLIRNKNV